MKKKLVVMFVIVVMLLGDKPGVAWACPNGEWYKCLDCTDEISSWKSDGPTTHSNTIKHCLKCITCGAQKYVTLPFQTEPHNWGIWYDGGHITGSNRHRQVRYCHNCNESQTTFYTCSGNPCWQPQYVPEPLIIASYEK